MRLDRFLSHATDLTRRQAQGAIRAGEVRVDGVPVRDPGMHVAGDADVEYASQSLALPGPRYFMLHKPEGVVCATRAERHRTVIDLLEVLNADDLHICGRLDVDATGLVLITDDGEWSHRVTAPRHKFPKTYRVTLAEPLGEQAAHHLERGVFLKEEKHRCLPAALERLGDTDVRLTLTEGKYHQVKRMFAAVGNHVVALHRERIGAVALDPDLPPGAARALTPEEIESFRNPPIPPAGTAPSPAISA
jgi:16S rRNA pseudouridine516 synthase